jgi:hypothetical protein
LRHKNKLRNENLTGKPTMRRSQRLIAAAVLLALSGALAGCSSGLSGFDPSDLLDWLDTKKKLPGDRKPVFPEGVPGLEQGVPKDLYKGAQEQQEQQNAAVAAAPAVPPPPADEPKAKRKSKAKSAPPAASSTGQEPAAEAAPEEDGTAAAPPPPKPKKIVRKRTTAPPPDQSTTQSGQSAQPAAPAQSAQQAPGAFPAPLPSGSFSR